MGAPLIRAGLAVALAACGPGEEAPARLTVSLRSGPLPPWIAAGSARVESVVVRGIGPAGTEAVAGEVGEVLALGGPPLDAALDLRPGEWPDVEVTANLAALDGQDALAVVGARGGASLAAVSLLLREDGGFVLPSAGATLVVELVPAEWEGLREGEGGGPIDPSDPEYDDVLDEIADTTRWTFPGRTDAD